MLAKEIVKRLRDEGLHVVIRLGLHHAQTLSERRVEIRADMGLSLAAICRCHRRACGSAGGLVPLRLGERRLHLCRSLVGFHVHDFPSSIVHK